MSKMKRGVLWFGLAVCVWYGLVLLFLPSLTHCGPCMGEVVARGTLMHHYWQVTEGLERFGDLQGSTLNRFFETTPRKTRYLPMVLSDESQALHWILLYPKRNWAYRNNLLIRILLLDYDRERFRPIALRNDGALCVLGSSFDAAHPPTSADLPAEALLRERCSDVNPQIAKWNENRKAANTVGIKP